MDLLIVASVAGDAGRWLVTLAGIGLIFLFWWYILPRFGSF